jgi:hypothetical protein
MCQALMVITTAYLAMVVSKTCKMFTKLATGVCSIKHYLLAMYRIWGAGKTTYIVSAHFRFFPLLFLLPTYPNLT